MLQFEERNCGGTRKKITYLMRKIKSCDRAVLSSNGIVSHARVDEERNCSETCSETIPYEDELKKSTLRHKLLS